MRERTWAYQRARPDPNECDKDGIRRAGNKPSQWESQRGLHVPWDELKEDMANPPKVDSCRAACRCIMMRWRAREWASELRTKESEDDGKKQESERGTTGNETLGRVPRLGWGATQRGCVSFLRSSSSEVYSRATETSENDGTARARRLTMKGRGEKTRKKRDEEERRRRRRRRRRRAEGEASSVGTSPLERTTHVDEWLSTRGSLADLNWPKCL